MLVTAAFASASCGSGEPLNQQGAVVVDGARTFDFGEVEGTTGDLFHGFVLTNRSRVTQRITDLKTSCGCLEARAEEREIAPGESATVEIGIDARFIVGTRKASVVVVFEDESVGPLFLETKVHIRPKYSVVVEPRFLNVPRNAEAGEVRAREGAGDGVYRLDPRGVGIDAGVGRLAAVARAEAGDGLGAVPVALRGRVRAQRGDRSRVRGAGEVVAVGERALADSIRQGGRRRSRELRRGGRALSIVIPRCGPGVRSRPGRRPEAERRVEPESGAEGDRAMKHAMILALLTVGVSYGLGGTGPVRMLSVAEAGSAVGGNTTQTDMKCLENIGHCDELNFGNPCQLQNDGDLCLNCWGDEDENLASNCVTSAGDSLL